MNTERLEALAAKIETMPHVNAWNPSTSGFNMKRWRAREDCGTVCCIGGTADVMRKARTSSEERTGKWLGLDALTSNRLFYPYAVRDFSSITPAHAAAVIRNLIKTGEVDWSVKAGDRP